MSWGKLKGKKQTGKIYLQPIKALYPEYMNIPHEKDRNISGKWARVMHRHFTTENSQMAHIFVKSCLFSWVIRDKTFHIQCLGKNSRGQSAEAWMFLPPDAGGCVAWLTWGSDGSPTAQQYSKCRPGSPPPASFLDMHNRGGPLWTYREQTLYLYAHWKPLVSFKMSSCPGSTPDWLNYDL